ncbi:MAG: glutamate--tRNA ligase [Phycisphaerae bacterium]|nr:glutamate--tRNA ligase [Phycisphaerae bacterium]
MQKIKTRFAPSPTGSLHVGGARTALFNYALARNLGGTFLVRIEDTDRARHNEDAVESIVRDLQWLGLEWDEGIGKDNPINAGPFQQSLRLDVYKKYLQQLLDEGKAYYAFDTPEELNALREAAQAEKRDFRYSRPETLPTAADVEKARAEGRPVVVRLLAPNRDIKIHDEVFGDVTIAADQQDDFIIAKADGYPTYHLANVVDDALMSINFILRGQEFLAQTWRHVALREALGFPEPKYAHLPLIMDMKGRKLSKRDGDVDVNLFRIAGYLPETMINFIALLGWNPKGDREKFSLAEMAELFSIGGIGKSNAKFDRDKLLSFNTDAMAAASDEHLLHCFKDFLSAQQPPVSIPTENDEILAQLLAATKGARTFADIVTKCEVLFDADDSFDYDPKSVKKVLAKNDGEGYAMLQTIAPLLTELDWSKEGIESWMHDFCEQNEVGMGKVAQPLRVALTGTSISPGIGDTLVLLGKDKTLARIERCIQSHNNDKE